MPLLIHVMKLLKSQWKISSSSAHTDALICMLSSGNSEFGTCHMRAWQMLHKLPFLSCFLGFRQSYALWWQHAGTGSYQPLSNCSKVASFCPFHIHRSLQCLLFSIIQPHNSNYVAVLSMLLLFVIARVHWRQLLPMAAGNIWETTESQLMLLWEVVKAGSLKPQYFAYSRCSLVGNIWMVFAGRQWLHWPMYQASQMPPNSCRKLQPA